MNRYNLIKNSLISLISEVNAYSILLKCVLAILNIFQSWDTSRLHLVLIELGIHFEI